MSIWRSRAFATYSVANGAAFAAAWMQRLALGWAVWNLTSSAFMLGVLAACDLGPALLLGPIGGILGDRLGARKVILATQIGIAVLTLALAAVLWRDAPVWALMAFAAMIGAGVALADAPRASIVTELVPPEQAAAAVALTAVVINCARFVGPALAGGIAAVASLPFVILAAAMASLPLLFFALTLSRSDKQKDVGTSHWTRDLIDGVRYARTHSIIGIVLLNFLLSSLLARGIYELVPGLVNAIFGGGFGAVSAMTTAIGVGAIASGLLMTRTKNADSALGMGFGAAFASGGVVVLLVAVPGFSWALAIAVVLGFTISMTAIAAQIAVQLSADEGMRSRVLSLWALIIRVGPAGGAMLIGWMADRTGFRPPLLVAGVAAALLAAVLWIAFRRRSVKPD